MKYKAIILDLDGTTVPSSLSGMPSSTVIEAIKHAQRKVRVSIATARYYDMSKDILQALNLKDPIVINGGSQIADPQTGKILWEEKISQNSIDKLLKIWKKYNAKLFFNEYLLDDTSLQKILKTTITIAVFVGVEKNILNSLHEELNEISDLSVHLMESWTDGVDIHITSKKATKLHGIQMLIKTLGVEKFQVIGVGDGLNDLPLFEAVGFKVAMGNAVDELKAASDYIAPTLNDDGLTHVIERFILNGR